MTTSIAPPPVTPSAVPVDPAATRAAGRGLGARLRDLRTTTPGRLRVESLVILALALAAGIVTSLVVADRLSATAFITDEAAPVIVSARQVQTNLAEANAAAANSFLAGGEEDPGQRAIYEESLANAGRSVETAARLIGDDAEAHDALAALNAALPRYAGLIETARANNRQGFPVGAAYLNAATRVLDDEINPATDLVANRAAARYRDAYDRQRNLGLILGAVALALVTALGLYLTVVLNQLRRRFRRTVNVPVALALALTTALAGWLAYGVANHTAHLAAARTQGYDGTRLFLDARTSGFGAKADEARFLIARGAGQAYEDRFQARTVAIDGTWADLTTQASGSSRPDAGPAVDTAAESWAGYLAVHQAIVTADQAGDREPAVELALTEGNTAFAAFDDATAQGLDLNQAVFRAEMDQARGALNGLRWGALVVAVLAALAAAYGLQQRINEYR